MSRGVKRRLWTHSPSSFVLFPTHADVAVAYGLRYERGLGGRPEAFLELLHMETDRRFRQMDGLPNRTIREPAGSEFQKVPIL